MSIDPNVFLKELLRNGVNFFAGVPDSLLKEFCLCVENKIDQDKHIITANEGSAIALASGYYLGRGGIPLVYMQNSGFGNALNPLLSLSDPDVYSIPIILLIGWRGDPAIEDEPQHKKQGKVQIDLLNAIHYPYEIIGKNDINFKQKIARAAQKAKKFSTPVILLVKKSTFSKSGFNKSCKPKNEMSRENALEIIIDNLSEDSALVSTTGKTSREIFEIRERRLDSHKKDFLTVGSMGHCSSIALGVALAKPKRPVVCIDGDGSMLMHLGALTNIATSNLKNFYYFLLNNRVHESVGGQDTAAKLIDLSSVVNSMHVFQQEKVNTRLKLKARLKNFFKKSGPCFMEIEISSNSRSNLGRPTIAPSENKLEFINFVRNQELK